MAIEFVMASFKLATIFNGNDKNFKLCVLCNVFPYRKQLHLRECQLIDKAETSGLKMQVQTIFPFPKLSNVNPKRYQMS